MAEKLLAGTPRWAPPIFTEESALEAVDEMFAAANSIPEGAPVGTIARRPDGAWIARKEQCGKWDYRPFTNQGEWPQPDDADSWPVIYDPREGEALPQAEPCQSIDPVSELKCSQTLGHEGNHGTCSGLEWFPPGEEPRVPRPDLTDHPTREELREYFHKDLAEHCQADDPTAQQEPQVEGNLSEIPNGSTQQEPPKGLYGKYRVERVDGKPIRACFVLEYLDDLHANKALLEYAFSVERVNPELAKDLRAEWGKWPGRSQQEPGESLARGLDDLAAGRVSRRDDYLEPQPEPKLCSGCYQCQAPKPPRTPRVVDSLGVDEQGSRWRGSRGSEYQHEDLGWRTNDGCLWRSPYEPWADAPYTEIVRPRVLPSLDCEEARDGTAWQAAFSNTVHRRGWKFWYVPAEREWHTDGGYDGSGPLNTLDFLTERGPYTEVLGDPS
ncbi:Uncharacterised protein [Mycobacteroides abscessus subsp. abscessus]|nr:Uncharacterised protein [Mycobacteroides abscessus subsp. abscessus]